MTGDEILRQIEYGAALSSITVALIYCQRAGLSSVVLDRLLEAKQEALKDEHRTQPERKSA